MLTKRQNMLECIRGGKPDRYVNQYEALNILMPNLLEDRSHLATEGYVIDGWGCYRRTVPGQPGMFPMHDMEHRVIRDIAEWRKQVKIPRDISSAEIWEPLAARAEAIDRNEEFVTIGVVPGIFERVHHLCEITEALVNFYDEPEAVHDLIDEITDWELRIAEQAAKWVKPDALFHHDDWGTKISTFMSLDMFEEFLLEPYKKVYGYYKDHGVELIVHHSDSFGETLVPYMIDMGIDVWQGTLRETNDIPKLIQQYGDKITFMGAIETAHVDKPDWTMEEIRAEVETAISAVGSKTSFIPCLTSGLNMSGYPGVYDAVTEVINEISKRDFA